jgi:hypothetical protein
MADFNFGQSGETLDFNFITVSDTSNEYDFNFGSGSKVFYIFLGSSNNFNNIWADKTASLYSGTFYVGRKEDLTIIKNYEEEAVISNYFSTTTSGNTQTTLKAQDSSDFILTY